MKRIKNKPLLFAEKYRAQNSLLMDGLVVYSNGGSKDCFLQYLLVENSLF